ncbi:MAG: hypothetical protein JWP09_800 [Candidatus Taylorbacteria bacterium]|nr:hypothetical protein [Candidatus Taylorbacteria bacterium]
MKNKLNILIVFVLLITASSAGFYFYFYNALGSYQQEAEDLKTKSKTLDSTLGNLDIIEQNLKGTVENGDKIAALFLGQDSIVDFIQNIEDLMKGVGVSGSVDSVVEQAVPELDAAGKEKINMVVSAQGDWSGLINLLGLLERLPYKSTVNSFSLRYADVVVEATKKKAASTNKVWQLKVNLDVWAVKKPDANPLPAEQNTDTGAPQDGNN